MELPTGVPIPFQESLPVVAKVLWPQWPRYNSILQIQLKVRVDILCALPKIPESSLLYIYGGVVTRVTKYADVRKGN